MTEMYIYEASKEHFKHFKFQNFLQNLAECMYMIEKYRIEVSMSISKSQISKFSSAHGEEINLSGKYKIETFWSISERQISKFSSIHGEGMNLTENIKIKSQDSVRLG